MKLKFLKSVLCLLLIASMMLLPATAMASSKTIQILKVNTDGARLRSEEDKSVITTLKSGAKVFYAGEHLDAYCKVCTMDGEIGYVYKAFLSEYGAVKSSQVYYTTAKAPVYRRSGSSLKKAGTAPENTFVLVYATNGNWAFVRSMGGASGYMKLNTLTKAF